MTTLPSQSRLRFATFSHALAFVAGFTLIFVIGWGGAATLLGTLFADLKVWLARLGGVVVILFGLHTLGVLRLNWLDVDTRVDLGMNVAVATGADRPKNSYATSTLMGVIFAAGWTPCIGTILGAILTLSFAQESSGTAMLLAGIYALGLGIPFLLISLLLNRAFIVTRWLRRYTRQVQIMSGLLLVGMGVLLLTNSLFYIAIWAQRSGLYIDPQLGSASVPTVGIALLAGALSFLSPCVLPLVPAYVGYLSSSAT